MNGCWVMVCGPSGAGKDSTLAWAAAALAPHPRICFARRLATRAAGPGADDEEASPSALDALDAAGELAWQWEAHGHRYAVRSAYEDRVRGGEIVVVNGSRAHVRCLGQRADVRRVLVTAPATLVAARLRLRSREDASAIAQRLVRNEALADIGADRVIENATTVEAAGEALRDYLLELAR